MMGNPVFFSCLLMWVTGPPIQSQRNGIVCLTKNASISFQQEGQTFRCQSVRKGKTNPPISFQVKYTPVSEVYFPKEGTLDHWLTERYCLFSSDNGNDHLLR